jgi:hypothetical protein
MARPINVRVAKLSDAHGVCTFFIAGLLDYQGFQYPHIHHCLPDAHRYDDPLLRMTGKCHLCKSPFGYDLIFPSGKNYKDN